MLNDFRKFAGGLTSKLMVLLLLAAVSVWGIGDIMRTPTGSGKVATVGNIDITQEQFARAYRNESEQLRRVLGKQFTPEMAQSFNLPGRVLETLVRQALLTNEAKELGLVPSDSDVVRRINDNPSFQDSNGNFEKVIFLTSLRSMGMTEKAYVEKLRHEIGADLLLDAMVTKLPVSNTAARVLYEAQEEKRNATLYTLTPSLIRDISQPTDEQIDTYYKQHASEFTAPEYRVLTYLTLATKDTQDNLAVSKEVLTAAYQERIDEFKRPEMRSVNQLLFASEADAKAVHAQLKGGADFAKVAATANIENKGSTSLGKVARNNIMEDAGDTVFALKQGEYTAPVKSPFGWHIYQVTGIEAPSTLSLEEATPALEKDLKQRMKDERLNKIANILEDSLAGGSTLPEAANQLGLKVTSLPPINRQGKMADGKEPKDLPSFDHFLDTAFKTDEKSESQLVPIKGDGFFIVRVERIESEHLRPLEDVKASVIAGWQKQERSTRLGELSRTLVARFSSADAAGRKALASEYNLTAAASGTLKRTADKDDDKPLPQPLLSEIFARSPGESTTAHATGAGNFVFAVVDNIVPATVPEKTTKSDPLQQVRKDLIEKSQSEVFEQYINHLENKFHVSINERAVAALSKE